MRVGDNHLCANPIERRLIYGAGSAEDRIPDNGVLRIARAAAVVTWG